MTMTAAAALGLRVSDVSGQKRVHAPAVPRGVTVSELVQRLTQKMGLARNDGEGRPIAYQARLDREGRHLHGSENVANALRDDDEIVLMPNIDAG
jgi:molybdopterin converting factor small subunit